MEILQLTCGKKEIKDACPGELKSSDAINRKRKKQTRVFGKESDEFPLGHIGLL